MRRYGVLFRPEAVEQLEELYDFIAEAGSPGSASAFTESIVLFCESLATFPFRGTARDDLRVGLRTIGYRKRVIIAYAIRNDTVTILGIFYGGRDHERLISTTEPPDLA